MSPPRRYRPGPVEGTELTLLRYDEERTGYGYFACSCGNEKRIRLRYVFVGYPAKGQQHNRTMTCGDKTKHTDKRDKGEDVLYKTAHDRLTRRHGRLPCVMCGKPKAEWSYLWSAAVPKVQPEGFKDAGLVYSIDGNDYAPMCRAGCHPKWEAASKAILDRAPKGAASLVHVALKEVGYFDHLTDRAQAS